MHLLSASFASSDGARLRRYIVHGIVQLRRARDIGRQALPHPLLGDRWSDAVGRRPISSSLLL